MCYINVMKLIALTEEKNHCNLFICNFSGGIKMKQYCKLGVSSVIRNLKQIIED